MEAARAYASLPFKVKAWTPVAPSSASKPRVSLNAESAASRVPLSWTRISWTPFDNLEATTAYVSLPFKVKASTLNGCPSASKPRVPLNAESAASRVPLSYMRISWVP